MHDVTRRTLLLGAGLGAVTLATGLGMRAALAAGKVKPGEQDALLVIDVQNCFVPGGSLAVKSCR
jgi:nicotinamidase/pyrazinamidase